jgi:hypothetical protein
MIEYMKGTSPSPSTSTNDGSDCSEDDEEEDTIAILNLARALVQCSTKFSPPSATPAKGKIIPTRVEEEGAIVLSNNPCARPLLGTAGLRVG